MYYFFVGVMLELSHHCLLHVPNNKCWKFHGVMFCNWCWSMTLFHIIILIFIIIHISHHILIFKRVRLTLHQILNIWFSTPPWNIIYIHRYIPWSESSQEYEMTKSHECLLIHFLSGPHHKIQHPSLCVDPYGTLHPYYSDIW